VHKPTFSPDKTPNLLLIAMMAIGASFLDKIHCYEETQNGSILVICRKKLKTSSPAASI
jgi:hypothetical protein